MMILIIVGDYRCTVQVDTGLMGTASICCSTNLCNSAVSMQTQTMISIILASLSVHLIDVIFLKFLS